MKLTVNLSKKIAAIDTTVLYFKIVWWYQFFSKYFSIGTFFLIHEYKTISNIQRLIFHNASTWLFDTCLRLHLLHCTSTLRELRSKVGFAYGINYISLGFNLQRLADGPNCNFINIYVFRCTECIHNCIRYIFRF